VMMDRVVWEFKKVSLYTINDMCCFLCFFLSIASSVSRVSRVSSVSPTCDAFHFIPMCRLSAVLSAYPYVRTCHFPS
jgi:hypothetical protein